ncbi:MAG: DNA-3-methyladenine glycosylase 2 family protein [Rhodospirillales bacterium]|nr:DNA-3-methyladenine glycosylase 2 family protein [Rhodospirillales bacterium]
MTDAPPPDESLRPALEALAACDADVARAYAHCGLPPVRGQAPGFAGLLAIMTSQQVSVHAARAILGRLREATDPLTPDTFLALDETDLKRIGFSRQKMRYGRALAEELLTGRLDLEGLAALDDDDAIARLIRVKGIGRWTAEIYLLFALRRPDVWPVDDLAVQVAAQRLKGLAERPSRKDMVELGEAWRPHRSAAARFLWHFYRHAGIPD